LIAPRLTFGASREEQEMQRDIAQLQDQVRALQSSFDQKLATIQTLVQQSLDAANSANTNVSVLGAGVGQTLSRELGDRLKPVAGLAAKVDNVASDSAEVRSAVADLTSQLNKTQQQLTDISNAIKVIQSPPAAPPPAANDPGAAAAPAGPGGVPPIPAQVLWANATGDYSGGKLDQAVTDFNDFLHFYPNDPNASAAQLQIGAIHSLQAKYDLAIADFDAALVRYPDNKRAPDAWFMKGQALKNAGRRGEAAETFRTLIRKYPSSDQAAEAKDQLRALGLN
jgi:TolA-binding protein